MINITQNTTNEVLVYAKSGLGTPYYLFRFVNRSTGDENTCIAANINSACSTCPLLFEIEENATQDRANGVLELSPVGHWDIYLYDQTSSSNLNYTLSNELLFQGYAHIFE